MNIEFGAIEASYKNLFMIHQPDSLKRGSSYTVNYEALVNKIKNNNDRIFECIQIK